MIKKHLLKISRLEGLSDGIFAIAMTILVLDLRIPLDLPAATLHDSIIHQVLPRLVIYIASFTILGTLWIAMNFQIGLLVRVNRPYLWANVFYLMVICVVPFSASLSTAHPTDRISIIFYATNLTMACFGQWLTIQCAYYYNLNSPQYTPEIRTAVLQRIFLAPVFYILAVIVSYWDNKVAFVLLLMPTFLYLFPGKIDTYDRW